MIKEVGAKATFGAFFITQLAYVFFSGIIWQNSGRIYAASFVGIYGSVGPLMMRRSKNGLRNGL